MRAMDEAALLADFDALLERMEHGERIAIYGNGRLIAYMLPIESEEKIAPVTEP